MLTLVFPTLYDGNRRSAGLSNWWFLPVDCSFFVDVDSRAKHFEARIQGAKFFNCSVVRDTTISHPMQVPTLDQFTLEMYWAWY